MPLVPPHDLPNLTGYGPAGYAVLDFYALGKVFEFGPLL
jgi:hypothetical protein